MNTYFLQILMKERQRDFAEEFRRIHQARAARNPGPKFTEGIIRQFRAISMPINSLMYYFKKGN
jgi:hypothetical protein